MNRRALLSAAGAVAASLPAGCLGLVRNATGSDCQSGTSIDLEPTTPSGTAEAVAEPVAELPPTGRDLLARAVADAGETRDGNGGVEDENGDVEDGGGDAEDGNGGDPEDGNGADADGATYAGAEGPPVPADYARVDGTYYRVRTTAGDGREVPGYEFAFASGTDLSDRPPASETVALDDLPAVDRRAFLAALDYPPPNGKRLRGISGEFTLAYADAGARERSVLVPDPSVAAVDYRGTVFGLEFESETTVTWRTYAVGVDPIADSASAFAAHVYDRLGVDLDAASLPDDATTVLEEASGEGGYSACEPYSESERAVLDALDLDGGDGNSGGEGGGDGNSLPRHARFARYEGYWHRVRVAQFVV